MRKSRSKAAVRRSVWKKLRSVARPNAFFHFNFAEYIADFEGSEKALRLLRKTALYRRARLIFITPDDCLEWLRDQALKDGKKVLVTSYGIRRGFFLLDPARIPADKFLYAGTLEGMERVASPIFLREMVALGSVDLLVTGAGAINYQGIRVGKGHGYFDLEWAIFYSLGMVTDETPVFSVIHDCQVVRNRFDAERFDTACDQIFTPTRSIRVRNPRKPTVGVIWSKLKGEMLRSIPPLRELRRMSKGGEAIENSHSQ